MPELYAFYHKERLMAPPSPAHRWYTPEDCAALLLAVKHGDGYRGPCPVHGGDNTSALHIWETRDTRGNAVTRIYCHTHQCDIRDICAYMGIALTNLFSIAPGHAQAMQHVPRAHSPRVRRLATMDAPSPDAIAQILLEELIVSDPLFLEACAPARQTMWQLAQASPLAKDQLTQALRDGHHIPSQVWAALARELGGGDDGPHP
jgi:hypothetical protein